MSDASKKKAKQRWTIEKPKLDNARQLREIFFFEPNVEEFKLTMKAARTKLEVPMPAAMPCRIPIKSSGENPPQYWETQDKIRLFCWCRRKHETKARRSWTQTSSWSHHCKRDEFYDSLQSCPQIHSDASSIKKFQTQRQQWRKKWKNWTKSRHDSGRKSERRKMWSMKRGIRTEKFILRHWWISVILRIRSWSLSVKSTKKESYSEVTL